MKVLLLEDVYNLGRAGDIKKVADGYGRNYLLPQNLAALATPGALKQADHIREQANTRRAALNQELGGMAEQLAEVELTFPAKASETGKLYGSITTQMIADRIKEDLGFDIDRRQLDTQPIRSLGEHMVNARLTVDLIPGFKVLVYREGESPEAMFAELEALREAELEEDTSVTETTPDVEGETEYIAEIDIEDPAQIEFDEVVEES
jgi:large subunit ribosomal protein L9